MKPIEETLYQQDGFNYLVDLPEKEDVKEKFKPTTIKGSQLLQPMLEFSGACAGCGETHYAKLATQLFGDRMLIANATGCSSIWGGSAPSTPYTVNKEGKGPAWANSLFEDNAEYGYGMFLANAQIREGLAQQALTLANGNSSVAGAAKNWLDTFDDSTANQKATKEFKEALADAVLDGDEAAAAKAISEKADFLNKKSQWIFGGDGWAYDIGFGGLDHVIAQNRDVNILVFDTEVYSNTGGQASKATPTGAIAQFAASGKIVKKKDLAAIAMSYGYVYVAQCSMGADRNQVIKAFNEAESYKGPSLIICYAPCINHGIKGWQKGIAQEEEKKAVQAGYWHNFRFDPRKAQNGENPFTLDSKAPTSDYKEFILGENRYNRLAKAFPEKADALFDDAQQSAKEKYDRLLRYQELYKPE